MSKKYNLILSKTRLGMCRYYLVGYVKDMDGDAYLNYKLSSEAFNKQYAQFTQDEIDKLKASLPTKGMRAVVDASKVEVKAPLYYMQTKRKDTYGMRLFFLFKEVKDLEDLESTDTWGQTSIENLLDNDCVSNHSLLRTKEEWEPYLTPDRELVEYDGDLDD